MKKLILATSLLMAVTTVSAFDSDYESPDVIWLDTPEQADDAWLYETQPDTTVESTGELIVNVASYHINAGVEYNEVNLGLGYRTEYDLEFGFFQNSYYNTDLLNASGNGYSLYIKTELYKAPVSKNVTYTFDIGVAYYGADGPSAVKPIFQPTLNFAVDKDITIKVGYLPDFAKDEVLVDGESTMTQMLGIITIAVGYTF